MYFVWVSLISPVFGSIVISIPTILLGSPKSVTANIPCRSVFALFIASSPFANSIRSSTHTVTNSISPFISCLYTQGSDTRRLKPFSVSFLFNCLFHSCPDCFNPYRVLISQHTQLIPLSKPLGCAI